MRQGEQVRTSRACKACPGHPKSAQRRGSVSPQPDGGGDDLLHEGLRVPRPPRHHRPNRPAVPGGPVHQGQPRHPRQHCDPAPGFSSICSVSRFATVLFQLRHRDPISKEKNQVFTLRITTTDDFRHRIQILIFDLYFPPDDCTCHHRTDRHDMLCGSLPPALCGVLGEYFVMLMTRLFGALATVTTTSCRKALTLCARPVITSQSLNIPHRAFQCDIRTLSYFPHSFSQIMNLIILG